MPPLGDLFEIACKEPRTDLFLCYLSGRLTSDPATAQMLVDAYNEWKAIFSD